MVRELRIVVALAAAFAATPAVGRPVVVRGRVVRHGSQPTPVARAEVKLYYVCPDPSRKDETVELKKTWADANGRYELSLDIEWKPACLYAQSERYMGGHKDVIIATAEIDAGDLPLKPLATGLVNFGALVDAYAAAFESSDASAENEFLVKVSASVKSREENKESARQMYLTSRKFRFFIDEGCRKDSDACKVLVRDVVEWKPRKK